MGLDWADQQHVICLYDVGTGKREIARLEQKQEALEDWLSELRNALAKRKWNSLGARARGGDLCTVERGLSAAVSVNKIAGQLPQGLCPQWG